MGRNGAGRGRYIIANPLSGFDSRVPTENVKGTLVLDKITSWKQFERLCADLLSAEGLLIDSASESSVDTTGTDFKATEEFRSHSGAVMRVRWRVQCKHYARSGTNLNRDEVSVLLNLFEATAAPDEGLFIITSTDYTEPATKVIDDYLTNHRGRRITLWNQRQLISKLERHSDISKRYGLKIDNADFSSIFGALKLKPEPLSVLLISDQSALAHDLTRGLRDLGSKLTFLPFWIYQDTTRLRFLHHTVFKEPIDLVICFLGDSFGLPLPSILVDTIMSSHRQGSSILLFPFLAWCLKRGINAGLRDVIPVELLDPREAKESDVSPRVGDYRKGDFRWLLAFDSFAEDRYMELTADGNDDEFAKDISDKFGLSHSFEFLRPLRGARVRFKDTAGNPLVVTREDSHGKVCYLNTCCHSCLSDVPVSSPLSSSTDFAVLLRNVLIWLTRRN